MVKADRERYVSLALTVVMGWIAAGKPRADVRPVNSFGVWSDYCRHALLWLGEVDPCHCMFEAMAVDPERETLKQLLEAWHEKFGPHGRMVREVIKILGIDDDLTESIKEIAGERDGSISQRKLGWWLKRHENKVADGKRFVNDGCSRGSVRWKVQVLKVSQVSNNQPQDFCSNNDVERF
jgi:hypothetical protein